MTPATTTAPLRRADQVELVELGGVWVHKSLPALYQQRVTEHGADLCEWHKEGGEWKGSSAAQGAVRVKRVTLGLLELGVKKGDRVALVCETRPEWVLVDLAILHAGAVTVGVYPTLPTSEVAYLLEHSGARVVVVEDAEQLEKVHAMREKLPNIEHVVVIDPPPHGPAKGEQTLAMLEGRGTAAKDGDERFRAAWRAVGHDDLATIIYTSGTTGAPKGAMLTHGNLTFTTTVSASIVP